MVHGTPETHSVSCGFRLNQQQKQAPRPEDLSKGLLATRDSQHSSSPRIPRPWWKVPHVIQRAVPPMLPLNKGTPLPPQTKLEPTKMGPRSFMAKSAGGHNFPPGCVLFSRLPFLVGFKGKPKGHLLFLVVRKNNENIYSSSNT